MLKEIFELIEFTIEFSNQQPSNFFRVKEQKAKTLKENLIKEFNLDYKSPDEFEQKN